LLGFLCSRKGKVIKNNFEKWAITTFGRGIAKHFMLPYNKKLWKFKLSGLTINWLGRFVPVPSVDEIFRGITPDKIDAGYNVFFYYPQKGGIESVVKDVYKKVKQNVLLNSEVKFIDLKNKILYFNRDKISYNHIISSMNLRQLIKITGDKKLIRLASGLKAVSVYSLNVGFVDRNKNDKHWIYFPEEKYPFYRAGFFSQFSGFNAPRGMSSVFVETTFRNKPPYSIDSKIINDLIDMGIVRSRRDIKLIYPMILKDAYVIFDKEREKVLPEIKAHLEKHGIFPVGRWGKWEYSSMEDAILDGFDAAEKILNKG
jgi:UDP-galactopyranose mutase